MIKSKKSEICIKFDAFVADLVPSRRENWQFCSSVVKCFSDEEGSDGQSRGTENELHVENGWENWYDLKNVAKQWKKRIEIGNLTQIGDRNGQNFRNSADGNLKNLKWNVKF